MATLRGERIDESRAVRSDRHPAAGARSTRGSKATCARRVHDWQAYLRAVGADVDAVMDRVTRRQPARAHLGDAVPVRPDRNRVRSRVRLSDLTPRTSTGSQIATTSSSRPRSTPVTASGRFLDVTPELMFLLGFYLAEGVLLGSRRSSTRDRQVQRASRCPSFEPRSGRSSASSLAVPRRPRRVPKSRS